MLSSESSASSSASSKCKAIKLSLLPNQKVMLCFAMKTSFFLYLALLCKFISFIFPLLLRVARCCSNYFAIDNNDYFIFYRSLFYLFISLFCFLCLVSLDVVNTFTGCSFSTESRQNQVSS